MTEEELLFFAARPGSLPIYEALRQRLLERCPETEIRVKRTQIGFFARHGFAFVSLRRMRGCPESFIILSLGMDRPLDSPRVASAVEPYPRRWTNHLILTDPKELDGELLDWLREARDDALTK